MMNLTVMPYARVDRRRAQPEAPAPCTSPRLAEAMGELEGYIRRQPDVTLGELRAAFMGTGFQWDRHGNLVFSPSRRALIAEFDELIERHGWGAQGALLFL